MTPLESVKDYINSPASTSLGIYHYMHLQALLAIAEALTPKQEVVKK